MNKRYWINIIIAALSAPVDSILRHCNVSLEIRYVWLGITLACAINGVANIIAEYQEMKKNKVKVVAVCDKDDTLLAMVDLETLEVVEADNYKVMTNLDDISPKINKDGDTVSLKK